MNILPSARWISTVAPSCLYDQTPSKNSANTEVDSPSECMYSCGSAISSGCDSSSSGGVGAFLGAEPGPTFESFATFESFPTFESFATFDPAFEPDKVLSTL